MAAFSTPFRILSTTVIYTRTREGAGSYKQTNKHDLWGKGRDCGAGGFINYWGLGDQSFDVDLDKQRSKQKQILEAKAKNSISFKVLMRTKVLLRSCTAQVCLGKIKLAPSN